MTAPEPGGLPDGELVMVGDAELLLAERFRADAFASYQWQEAGEQLLLMLTFACRVNRSDERKTVTILVHPEDAEDMATRLIAAQITCERRAAQTGAGS